MRFQDCLSMRTRCNHERPQSTLTRVKSRPFDFKSRRVWLTWRSESLTKRVKSQARSRSVCATLLATLTTAHVKRSAKRPVRYSGTWHSLRPNSGSISVRLHKQISTSSQVGRTEECSVGAETTDERCRDARHGRPEGSADTRRRNQRSVVPIPKGEVIVKFRDLVPVSAHVTLSAVQIKKGHVVFACFFCAHRFAFLPSH